MTIQTSTYFFNAEQHTEMAEEANAIASRKNVQVSRWVNNSKGRQIVTYMVHTGERAARAVDQQDVQFKTSFDAGRGGRVKNETGMLNEVMAFLNSIEEPQEIVIELGTDDYINISNQDDGYYYSFSGTTRDGLVYDGEDYGPFDTAAAAEQAARDHMQTETDNNLIDEQFNG